MSSPNHALKLYSVCRLFDIFMIFGTLGLAICYVWARALGHVGTFCDISDLVINLPERILFRMDFALLGSFLAFFAFPIHTLLKSRGGSCWATVAAVCQVISGVGVILVGACGPEEIYQIHDTAAAMGFGGSGIAQVILCVIFYNYDKKNMKNASTLLIARCVLSTCFFVAAVIFLLCECDVLKQPFGHISEWCLYFFLFIWLTKKMISRINLCQKSDLFWLPYHNIYIETQKWRPERIIPSIDALAHLNPMTQFGAALP